MVPPSTVHAAGASLRCGSARSLHPHVHGTHPAPPNPAAPHPPLAPPPVVLRGTTSTRLDASPVPCSSRGTPGAVITARCERCWRRAGPGRLPAPLAPGAGLGGGRCVGLTPLLWGHLGTRCWGHGSHHPNRSSLRSPFPVLGEVPGPPQTSPCPPQRQPGAPHPGGLEQLGTGKGSNHAWPRSPPLNPPKPLQKQRAATQRGGHGGGLGVPSRVSVSLGGGTGGGAVRV